MKNQFLKHIEKRIFKRLDAELPVEVEFGNNKVKTTTSNISCGGLFLNLTPKDANHGNLDLFLELPDEEKEIRLLGEIRRHQKAPLRGVAVQFMGLYDDNLLALEKYVKNKLN